MSNPGCNPSPIDLETDAGLDAYVSALGGAGGDQWGIWKLLVEMGIDQYRAAAAVNKIFGPDRER